MKRIIDFIKNNIFIIALICAIFGCVLILNIATMISPDDYSYANNVAGADLKITSLFELVNAADFFYNGWTGRIIPHLLVGIFMTTSVTFFKILNSTIFIVFLIIITRFITKKNTFMSMVTAFGFLVYGKMFGEKFAWISGSLNYLWTSTALMFYLYTIYGYFVENNNLKKWKKITLIVLSIVVGALHEVMSFVGGAFLGVLFLVNAKKVWKKSKKDLIFLIIIIILFGIGCLINILAPGNIARSTMEQSQKGTIFSCLGNYKDIKWQIIIAIVLAFVIRFFGEKELFKREIIYCVIPCIIATIPFAILGYFPPRCFVPYEALIIITTSANIQFLEKKFVNYKKILIGICVIITIIVFAKILPTTYSDIRYILPYKLKVTKQLEIASENGDKDVIVSKFLFTDKIHMEDMINIYNFFIETNSDSVVNTFASIYYKFDKLRAISDIDYFVEIETDIQESVDYGIINKDTLELISIVTASDKITFTIPKDKFGTYVVDCRDKDLRSHVKSVRIRAVGEEMENPNIEDLINQE